MEMTASRSRWRELDGGVLLSSPKPEKNSYFLPSDRDREMLSSVFYTPAANFFNHTPGQHPPHITGRCVNTVILEWVGASDERAPFRGHDAVVCFVNRCLSRTRNLAASKINTSLSFSQADLCPTSSQDTFYLFYSKVWDFCFEESCS